MENQYRHLFAILVFCLSACSLSSCLKDKTSPVGGCLTEVSYTVDIRPIIESSCKTGLGPGTGCHDAWIDSYSAIETSLDGGAWQNEIFVEMTMPLIPNDFGIDSLTEDEIQTMRCWIEQGYPEN
jgi:hypothetical protein